MKIKYQYSTSLQFTSYTCFSIFHLGRYISVSRARNCATRKVKGIYRSLLSLVFCQKICLSRSRIVLPTELCCQHILQDNSSHLQWGCLSRYHRRLISRVPPLLCTHIGPGWGFPQINSQPDALGPLQLPLFSQLQPDGVE